MAFDRLMLELGLDQAKFKTELTNAQNRLQSFSAKTSKYLNNIEQAANSINSNTRLMFWADIGSRAGGAFSMLTQYADSYTEIANKLRLVETAGIDSAKGMQSIFDISMQTNQSIQATSDVYQRFAQNAQTLGISQAQVASLTETVSKAVAISGASAESAQAALMQFGQSLASGVFRGEEFNSVMEQTPGLVQAIAKGLGVTTGELRNMAKDGKLTMDILIPALEKAKASVDEQFSTRVLTVSAAFENLKTATTKWIGEADQAMGSSEKLANAIGVVSEHLTGFATGAGVLGLGLLAGKLKSLVTIGHQEAASALAVAEAETVRTAALRQQATAEMNLLQIKAGGAKTDAERLAMVNQLSLAEAKLTGAINAEAAAQRNLAIAQKQTNALSRLGAGALSLVGGPLGAISIALGIGVGAWLDYNQKTEEAHQKALAFANDLPNVTAELNKMTAAQLAANKAKAEESIIEQQKEVDKLKRKIEDLQKTIAKTPKIDVTPPDDFGVKVTLDNTNRLAQLNRDLAKSTAELEERQSKLNDTQDANNAISDQLSMRTQEMIGFVDRYSDLTLTSENRINTWADEASKAIVDFDGLTSSVNGLSGALAKLSGMSLSIPGAADVAPQLSDAAKNMIEKSKRQAAIAKEKDPTKRAKLQAEDFALGLDKSKFSEYDIAQIQAQKEAEYLANASRRTGRKSGRKGAGTDYQKQYTNQLTEMQQRLAELKSNTVDIRQNGQISQYQEVNNLTKDIAANAEKYKNFGKEGLEKLRAMAEQIDSAQQQFNIAQFSHDNDEKLAAMQFELSLMGKTAEQQEILRYNHQLDLEAAKMKIGMSQENIAKLDEEIARLKVRREEIEKQKQDYNKDPINGIKAGFAQIEADVTNVAANMQNITVSAFGGMADALTDFVMTGKADFKSLATSIISDISKMIIKMMLFNAIKQGMSAMGFGFADGGAVGGYAQGGLVGFDEGGFTGLGGKYSPAGIVHKGEYVITKEATSRIGLDYLNYLNYGNGRGFANGGAVGRVNTGYSKLVQGGGDNISVKVINNGEPTQADVSTKRNGNELEITIELMRQIAKSEANNAIQNNFRAGGAFA